MSGPSPRVDRRGAVTLLPHIPVVGEAVTGTRTDPDKMLDSQVRLWERSLC